MRALETERENTLLRNPPAPPFATAGRLRPSSPPPDDDAAPRRRPAVSFSTALRTKHLDDLLRQATTSGIRQVVPLGAGTDNRAYRIDRPESTRLFESDTAAPPDFKTSVLRQEQASRTLPADHRHDRPACGLAGRAGRSRTQPARQADLSNPPIGRVPPPLGNRHRKA